MRVYRCALPSPPPLPARGHPFCSDAGPEAQTQCPLRLQAIGRSEGRECGKLRNVAPAGSSSQTGWVSSRYTETTLPPPLLRVARYQSRGSARCF